MPLPSNPLKIALTVSDGTVEGSLIIEGRAQLAFFFKFSEDYDDPVATALAFLMAMEQRLVDLGVESPGVVQ